MLAECLLGGFFNFGEPAEWFLFGFVQPEKGSLSQWRDPREHEIDRKIGAVSAVMHSLCRSVILKKKLSQKA